MPPSSKAAKFHGEFVPFCPERPDGSSISGTIIRYRHSGSMGFQTLRADSAIACDPPVPSKKGPACAAGLKGERTQLRFRKHGGFLEMPSSRAEYYRRQANICLRLSLAAIDDEACTRLLAMARHFKSKADAAEHESRLPLSPLAANVGPVVPR